VLVVCTTSKCLVRREATSDPRIYWSRLLCSFNFDPSELQVIGSQIQKLERPSLDVKPAPHWRARRCSFPPNPETNKGVPGPPWNLSLSESPRNLLNSQICKRANHRQKPATINLPSLKWTWKCSRPFLPTLSKSYMTSEGTLDGNEFQVQSWQMLN